MLSEPSARRPCRVITQAIAAFIYDQRIQHHDLLRQKRDTSANKQIIIIGNCSNFPKKKSGLGGTLHLQLLTWYRGVLLEFLIIFERVSMCRGSFSVPD